MSDFEDDYDDDFDLGEYFYVEETYDEVGDLAEHAYPSPPPVDYDEDEFDWDRFNYWNDIEYDSDGYHDVNAEQTAKRKRKNAQPPPKGRLKRRGEPTDGSDAKRRKAEDGRMLPPSSSSTDLLVSPVAWRQRNRAPSPVEKGTSAPFALLKDWRSRFPDGASSGSASAKDVDEDGKAIDIDSDVLLQALRSNLGKITGGKAAEELGADEAMLLQHITKMLTDEKLSADDVAGELADALFARDDASVASDAVDEKRGDGEFGQWILKQAQEKSSPARPSRGATAGNLSPSEDEEKLPASTPHVLPAERRPPTPSSTETGSSQKTIEEKTAPLGSPAAPATMTANPGMSVTTNVRSRKRKADASDEGQSQQAPPKRMATRNFAAATESSRARSSGGDVEEKKTTRKATRASKK